MTAMMREHRRESAKRHLGWWLLTTIAVLVWVGLAGTFAIAFWTSQDSSNPATAKADTMPQGASPTLVNVPGLASVTLTWSQAVTNASSGSVPITDYVITRYPSGSATMSSQFTCTWAIACLDAVVPQGLWEYTVTPRRYNWIGTPSVRSAQLSIDLTPPSVTMTNTGVYRNATWSTPCGASALCGTASDTNLVGASVSIQRASDSKWWNGSTMVTSASPVLLTPSTSAALPQSSPITWSLPFTPPSDGAYAVTVNASDAGLSTSINRTLTVDNVAPTTTDNAPAGWALSNVTVTLSPTDATSGVASTTYTLDGGAPTTGTSVSVTTDGTHTITYWSTDGAGNVEATNTVTVQLDKASPTVTLTAPSSIKNGQSLTATATDGGSGMASVQYFRCQIALCDPTTSIGTSSTSPFSFAWSAQPTDGSYRIKAVATDVAGRTTASAVSSITVDNTAPTTTDNATSTWRNTSVTVTLTPSDAGSGVAATYYTTDGSTPTTASAQGTSIVLSTAGTYTIKYFSVDALGNTESVKTAVNQVRIDTTAPSNAITFPLNGSTLNASGYTAGCSTPATDDLCGTASDAGSGVASVSVTIKRLSDNLTWNGLSWAAGTNTLSPTLSAGTWTVPLGIGNLTSGVAYQVTTTATDTAGNTSTPVSSTVTADLTAPTVSSMVMQDTNANGKVDRVVITFNEMLWIYGAGNTPWSLSNVPSGGSLNSVSVSGSTVTLTVNEGAGAADTSVGAFSVSLSAVSAGISDMAGNLSSFGATAPSDGAAPIRTAMTILDTNANGKIDRIDATFSENLGTYTPTTAPWTLTNVPSAGTIASVARVGSALRLTLNEGAGAADTSVGALTVALGASSVGAADTAGNTGSFTAAGPTDAAAPARTAMSMQDTNANGKIDRVVVTFSETLASYTAANTPWSLASVPSSGTLASVAVVTDTATLTLNEGAGAVDTAVGSFTIQLAANAAGIRDGASNQTSFSATAPTDAAAPARTAMSMQDADNDGRVDRITVTFSETLAAYTAGTTPWTLANVPSSGTLASVAVATNTATLTITEGAGAANTAVGSLTVALAANAAGIRDAASNQSSFAAAAPSDGASPVVVSIGTTNVFFAGLAENGDAIVYGFSEAVTATSTASQQFNIVSGGNTYSMPNVASGSFGRTDYVLLGLSKSWSSSTITVSGSNVTVTLGTGFGLTLANTALGTGTVTATPSTNIKDAAGNTAAGTYSTRDAHVLSVACTIGNLAAMSEPTVASFPLQEFLGFTMTKGEGSATATLDLDAHHRNPNGVAHGAVPFTLMDTAMGAATMSVVREGCFCATIEMHTRFIAAATVGTLTAIATVVSAGKRIVHLEAKTTDSAGKLIATATASFAVIEPKR